VSRCKLGRFASLGLKRASPLRRLSASTVSLHVARLRRFTTTPNPRQILGFPPRLDVRFGSKADICSAQAHVRFTPNSDRESGLPQTVMFALPPKADMCGATAYVRYGPKADISHFTRSPRRHGRAVVVKR